MKINKLSLIIAALFCICHTGWMQTIISRDSILAGYTPIEGKYDTLDGVFLFENRIDAYVEGGDAIIKGNDLVHEGTVSKELYQQGIFTYYSSLFHYQRMADKNPNIHFDTASVFKVFGEIRYKAVQDGTLWGETDINPFCGGYYKKYRIKMEVLYLGSVIQRTPLFMNCKELKEYMRKNKGKNYEMCILPTYLITRVFEYEEL